MPFLAESFFFSSFFSSRFFVFAAGAVRFF